MAAQDSGAPAVAGDGLAALEGRPGLAKLDALWARGREFFGTRCAILGGAMTWVSERNLVAAISNAAASASSPAAA